MPTISSDGPDTAAVLERIVVVSCDGERVEVGGVGLCAADEALEPGYPLVVRGVGNDGLEAPTSDAG
jgi:hypothetical protein